MTIDPAILQAVAAAEQLVGNSPRLPVRTSRVLGTLTPGVGSPDQPNTGASIPPFVRGLAAALLDTANAIEAAAVFTTQQDTDTPITDINWIRFTGTALVSEVGDNVAQIQTGSPDPGQLLSAARVGTTADLGATYTVDAGGPFLDQLELPAAPTIDGVSTWVLNDRVLVKDQTTGAENGVYEVIQLGPTWILQRVPDYLSAQTPGLIIETLEGTANANVIWQQTDPDTNPVTVGGAGGDTLVFSTFGGVATGVLLQTTVGATGRYTSIANAITGFLAGEWGNGVSFDVRFVSAITETVDFSTLPVTVGLVSLSNYSGAGTCTVTASSAVSGVAHFALLGDVAYVVDGVTTGAVVTTTTKILSILVTDGASITAGVGSAGQFDLMRTGAFSTLTVSNGAVVSGFDAVNRLPGGSGNPLTTVILVQGTLTQADVGTTLSNINIDARDSAIQLNNVFVQNGTVRSCTWALTNRLSTQVFDDTSLCYFADTDFTLTRESGGSKFVFVLDGIYESCTFTVTDGAGAIAGTVELESSDIDTQGVLRDCTFALDTTLGTGITSSSGFAPFRLERVVFGTVGAFTLDPDENRSTEYNSVNIGPTADLTIQPRVVHGLTVIAAGTDQTILVGGKGSATNDFNNFTSDVLLDLTGATSYTVQVTGREIEGVSVLNPEPLAPATSLVIGNGSLVFLEYVETTRVSGVDVVSTRGTGADGGGMTVRGINVSSVTWRQATGEDRTLGVTLVGSYFSGIQIAGDLNVQFRAFESSPLVTDQGAGLIGAFVTDTLTISSTSPTPDGEYPHHLLNGVMVAGSTIFQPPSVPACNLTLSNCRFIGTPDFSSGGTYERVAIASTISDNPVTISAVTSKAIGTSVIGIT